MWPSFKTKLSIYQLKANLDVKEFCVVTSHIFKNQQLEKMNVRGLYENREFHTPYWSMIHVTSKFKWSVSEIEFRFQ